VHNRERCSREEYSREEHSREHSREARALGLLFEWMRWAKKRSPAPHTVCATGMRT